MRHALIALGSCLLATAALADPQPVADPVPPIEKGDLIVATRVVAQLPRLPDAPDAKNANDAHARIQNLFPARDGSEDLFVNDLRGVLYRLHRDRPEEAAAVTPYLDLRKADGGFTNVFSGNESGLAGFAFHPDFAREGRPGFGKLYVAFSAPAGKIDYPGDGNASHDSVIMEFATNNPKAQTFELSSRREVLRVGQAGDGHNVGTLSFNPTVSPDDPDYGMLYASFGDGTGHFDPTNAGQRKNVPNGKILRFNPLQGPNGERHTPPRDNPFVSEPGAAPLVYCYGLRHPQHYSWDLGGSHRLFIAEMGQDQVEEVNIGVRGGNYGWRQREGLFTTPMAIGLSGREVYPREADPRAQDDFLDPVCQYDHDDGKAISSVIVYRGSLVPQLHGKLLCADIVNGKIFYADEAQLQQGKQTPLRELRLVIDGKEQTLLDVARHSGERVDLRLGQDAKGEVYLLTKGDGRVRQLVVE